MLGKFKRAFDKIPTGIPTGVIIALILWLTLSPNPTGDIKVTFWDGFDKVAHGIMFGFLTLTVLLELMKKIHWNHVMMPLVALVAFLSSIFGLIVEIAQRAMGLGRTFEIYDMLADASGAMIAAGIFAVFQDFLVDRNQ